MKLSRWLTPGIGIKRWVGKMIIGIILLTYSIVGFLYTLNRGIEYNGFFIFILFLGVFFLVSGIKNYTKKIITLINFEALNIGSNRKLKNIIYEKSILVKGPKIVAIGGGTGLSNMLRGLKKYTSNITAIVTVADDGGGSGMLREDLGMLPPGDIRNCIIALADTEPVMEDLFEYRFKEGILENQNFGNLFLAAMDGISDNFLEAVKKTSSVLAVTGRVLPVTLDNVQLFARLKNGSLVRGESTIPKECIKRNSPIEQVFLEPKEVAGVKEATDAILEADAIVFGPGSVYTSVIPNLMVSDVREAIEKSSGLKIYVCNIMTQPGESDNFTVQDHIRALYKHCEGLSIDYAIINRTNDGSDYETKRKYLDEGADFVKLEEGKNDGLKVKYIQSNIMKIKNGYIRHDENKLANIVIETILNKKMSKDEKRLLEFLYLSQKLEEDKKDRE